MERGAGWVLSEEGRVALLVGVGGPRGGSACRDSVDEDLRPFGVRPDEGKERGGGDKRC
jgi:hypothetical protein